MSEERDGPREHDANTFGADLIREERNRQLDFECHTFRHDDGHGSGELALAAAMYAAPKRLYYCREVALGIGFYDAWPWSIDWDKRLQYGERRENPHKLPPPDPDTYTHAERIDLLVKAGALIAAEIDRLHRLERKEKEGSTS